MDEITKQKLEAIIRHDIENMPYKFRELHTMFFDGIGAYKNFSKEEINEIFDDLELEITEQDIEWAKYNN